MRNILVVFCTICALIVVVIPYGCSKQTSPTEPELQELEGNWNWTKSVGGMAGMTITPASAGYTKRILLRSDNTCEVYRNDTLTATSQFTIRREKTPFSSDSVDVIHYTDTTRFMKQIVSLSGHDTLRLVDLCYDCFGHAYGRIK